MAIVYAVKSGNWSDPTVWNTGQLPTSADDVYSNAFTVTINTSVTVNSLGNTAATGVANGGFFVPVSGIAVALASPVWGIAQGTGSSSSVIASSLTSGQSFSIIGNLKGNSVFQSPFATGAVLNAGAGTINIIGELEGGNNYQCAAVLNSGVGVINFTGTARGQSSPGGNALSNPAIVNLSTGTVNITGDCLGGSVGNSPGVMNNSNGSVGVIGNCVGGTAAAGVANYLSGVVTVNGTISASNGAAGISSSSPSAPVYLSGPFITSQTGVNPVFAAAWRWTSSSPASYFQVRSADLAVIRPLYTADSVGGNPATTDVRLGTVYGPSNELTGTLAVPPAGSVAIGVPVGNTVGTASLASASPTEIAAAVWAASSRTITDKAGFSLTEAERTAISTAVQAGILNEGDGQLVLNAIVGAIGNINVNEVALIAAIRADMERIGGVLATRATASQVRTELAAELARMLNAATTQEVAEIVEGALTANPY